MNKGQELIPKQGEVALKFPSAAKSMFEVFGEMIPVSSGWGVEVGDAFLIE